MLSAEIEKTISFAVQVAQEAHHEFVTTEHLLLALLDNRSAQQVISACGGEIELLRDDLVKYMEEHLPHLPDEEDFQTQPSIGFQRVIQRAVLHVQGSGKGQVEGANVLIALFAEKDSYAAYFLDQQDITRYDAVSYISHGVLSDDSDQIPELPAPDQAGEEPQTGPLESYTQNLNELALEGRIDPLIGREKELERTVQILCRRRKNNPLFVGESGVGKTAI
ncbi:MAG TPA: ATP-dependent Clp protease ATP-binding subunit ClpA, partial [Gammaproteobacteria bacterium]|nr:ATP-dependent Clp protease ATP-binding subunit ClpA [Gammaproteobacteria bacterium]